MHRHRSRRQKQIQLTLTYVLMVFLIVVTVTVLALFVSGYRFNGENGKFVQGGLVQLDSMPNGADVTIDGAVFHNKTQTHATLFAGMHNFIMSKPGYNDWRDQVDIAPGNVVWLTYPRLVPTKLTPTVVAKYSAITSAKSSSDGKYIAYDTPAKSTDIEVADISGDAVTTTAISIPTKVLAVPAASKGSHFVIKAWSGDNRYLLVEHMYGKNNIEWLRVDTTGSHDVRNISSELAIGLTDLAFRPSSSSQFYGLTANGDLRLINLSPDTIGAPLESNVASYRINDDKTLTYVSAYDAQTRMRTAGYISDGASHGQVLRSYSDNGKTNLHIATDTYYGTRYFAISYGTELDIIDANVPNSDDTNGTSKLQLYRKLTLPNANAVDLAFRTGGRFIVANGDGQTSVYDFGLDNYTTMKNSDKTQPQQWLDNYIAWSVNDGKLQITDFDGANRHDIMPATKSLDATLSPNGKYLYAFTTTKAGEVLLTRVQMTL